MTSPPAKHNPPDNGPGREDADAHPPLGQVEAGPERHSDDPFMTMAREVVEAWWHGPLAAGNDAGLTAALAAALRSVDRAAREECARIADDAGREPFARGAFPIRDAIRNTIRG